MIAIDIVQEDGLVVQADQFGHQRQGDHLTLTKRRAGTGALVVRLHVGLKDLIDGDIDIGAQILERVYHGWVSLLSMVFAKHP